MDARADWVSLMLWSNTTGSNVALRSERVVFASMLTSSCLSARSQGVAGETLALYHRRAIAGFLHQLEGRLEVIHVQAHRLVQVGNGLSRHQPRVTLMS